MRHLLHPARSRWMRILGVAFVMYVLSFIDRTNIAMAIPSMHRDLGLTATAVGFATRMVFWGYLIAGVWSAKRVIMVQLILWCGVALSTAFVTTGTELMLNRFALGLSEGGVLTCTIVLIRAWFTRPERARANTMFLLSLAVAPVIANPISGFILKHSTWRTMFIVEAAPAILWGFVWWWAISDSPRDVNWLDPTEKARLIATLDEEVREAGPVRGHWLATLWHPAVLLLALYNFMALMAEWGVNIWLPTLLRETGLSIGMVGMLAALPYALGIVMMILVARSSDRLRERKWHMIAATACSGLFLFCAQLSGVMGIFGTVLFLSLAVGSFLGRFGPFWTLPAEVLPPAVAGVGIGLINGAGNLGGTVGPYFFGAVRDATGSFNLALTVGGISLILGSLVAIPIRTRRVFAPEPGCATVIERNDG
jgi:MFS family permease